MKKLTIALPLVLLCGCNVRERLDLGSAKAVKQNQEKINEIIPVLQSRAKTDARFAAVMVEEFPEILSFKEIAKAHERSYTEAAAITKADLDPYASFGELGSLIKKLNWLFSKEGLLWIIGALMGVGGIGGGGAIFKLMGNVKAANEKAKRAHRADPGEDFNAI